MAYMQCWCYLRKDAAEPLCAVTHALGSLDECGVAQLRLEQRQNVQVVCALRGRRAEVREHAAEHRLDCQALDLGVATVTTGLMSAKYGQRSRARKSAMTARPCAQKSGALAHTRGVVTKSRAQHERSDRA